MTIKRSAEDKSWKKLHSLHRAFIPKSDSEILQVLYVLKRESGGQERRGGFALVAFKPTQPPMLSLSPPPLIRGPIAETKPPPVCSLILAA